MLSRRSVRFAGAWTRHTVEQAGAHALIVIDVLHPTVIARADLAFLDEIREVIDVCPGVGFIPRAVETEHEALPERACCSRGGTVLECRFLVLSLRRLSTHSVPFPDQ